MSASCKIHINAPLAGVGESDKKAQKRTSRRRRQHSHPEEQTPRHGNAWLAFTAEHEALAAQIGTMGFGEAASQRASLHVDGKEERLSEALDWLLSGPEGMDEPLPLTRGRAVDAMPPEGPAVGSSPQRAATDKAPKPQGAAANRWAALAGDSDACSEEDD